MMKAEWDNDKPTNGLALYPNHHWAMDGLFAVVWDKYPWPFRPNGQAQQEWNRMRFEDRVFI